MKSFFKSEFVAFAAIIGLAFSLFQSFEPFIEFCEWLQPVINAWRVYTYKFWEYVFFWFPLEISKGTMDLFNFSVCFFTILARTLYIVQEDQEKRQGVFIKASLHLRSRILPSMFVSIFFLAPEFDKFLFHSKAVDAALELNTVLLFKFIVLLLLIIFNTFTFFFELSKRSEAKLRGYQTYISKYFWRVTTFILALTFINAIGLYADTFL